VRLSYVSTTQIRLDPYGGLKLAINGSNRDLPGAGVTLSNSGLSASTLYYIYAYWTGSAVALEATTTSHSASATTGVRIKTADATRTLVGMARTDASSLFFETATSAGVASYYNRRSRAVFRQVTPSTASATPVTVGNAVQFLVWSDESIDTRISGYGQNNTAGAATLIYMLVDSTVIGYPSYGYSSAAGAQTPVGITHALGTTEGFHSLDAQVQIGTGGTGNWSYSISALTRI
jgi:hypothetical protein